MFSSKYITRDEVNKTITIQDVSATDILDISSFLQIRKDVAFLMKNGEEESPARFYSQQLFADSSFEEFLNYKEQLALQLKFLVRKLKASNLPITLPDTEHFFTSFAEIKAKGLSGKDFNMAMKKEAETFKNAMAVSINKNNYTAKINKIKVDEGRDKQ
ncbi:MAG: hypothetical protein J6J24_02155 [Clostridia bacterium]|nr:hypothetical protein [Clostridia bacterium]